MGTVAERVAKAVEQDPALRPIAERYIRVLQEVAISHEGQARTKPTGAAKPGTTSSKKTAVIMRFLLMLKAAQSVEEVRTIQAKYRQTIERLT